MNKSFVSILYALFERLNIVTISNEICLSCSYTRDKLHAIMLIRNHFIKNSSQSFLLLYTLGIRTYKVIHTYKVQGQSEKKQHFKQVVVTKNFDIS